MKKKNKPGTGKKQVVRRRSEEKKPVLTPPAALCRGLAVSYALTCAVFIGFALLLTYTELAESSIPAVSVICTVAASVLAGVLTARGVGQKGLVWGFAAGGCYAVILFALGLLLGKEAAFGLRQVTTAVIALCGGAAGGIVGVNL